MLLYADDTNITVNSPNPYNYQIIMEEIICNINKWFKANLLPLNLRGGRIGYNLVQEKTFVQTSSKKFLILIIGDVLSW